MNHTLKALSDASAQMVQRAGSVQQVRQSRAAVLAGLLAIASATTSGVAYAQSESRTTGQVVGGVAGFIAARAARLNTATTVGITLLAGAVGGEIASRRAPDALQTAKRVTAADRLLEPGAYLIAQEGKRSLDDGQMERMRVLVIRASGARQVAQELFGVYRQTELAAATSPEDRAAAQSMALARQELSRGVQAAGIALAHLRNATDVAGRQGYEVRGLVDVVRELSTYIDERGRYDYSSPLIFAEARRMQKDGGYKHFASLEGYGEFPGADTKRERYR